MRFHTAVNTNTTWNTNTTDYISSFAEYFGIETFCVGYLPQGKSTEKIEQNFIGKRNANDFNGFKYFWSQCSHAGPFGQLKFHLELVVYFGAGCSEQIKTSLSQSPFVTDEWW